MSDIERQLDKAASDVEASMSRKAGQRPSDFERRSRSRMATMIVTSVLVLAVGTAAVALTLGSVAETDSQSAAATTTGDSILDDGIVTEDEYRGAVAGVVACAADQGLELLVDFNDSNGHASFSGRGDGDRLDSCFEENLTNNVSLGWSVALGDLDLEEIRKNDIATFACVEQATGEDFGELSCDKFGYSTTQGQAAHDLAFEYQDHESWIACRGEILPELWPGDGHLEPEAGPEYGAPTEIMDRDGLTLWISSRSDGGCIEVTGQSRAEIGCGADTTVPISFGTGALFGKGFVAGWVPVNTRSVILTLADGTKIEATELGAAEDYELRFFLERVQINERYEVDLPVTVVAFDENGQEIARRVLSE